MSCPKCKGARIHFDSDINRYICPACGARFCGEELLL